MVFGRPGSGPEKSTTLTLVATPTCSVNRMKYRPIAAHRDRKVRQKFLFGYVLVYSPITRRMAQSRTLVGTKRSRVASLAAAVMV